MAVSISQILSLPHGKDDTARTGLPAYAKGGSVLMTGVELAKAELVRVEGMLVGSERAMAG